MKHLCNYINKDTQKHIKNAFTLSEVLITLVIIGVIAALTVPAVINKVNDMSYRSGYRKAYSDFKNVFVDDIAFGQFPIKNGNCYDPDFASFTYNKLKEKFRTAKTCENNNAFDCWVNADTVSGNAPYVSSYAFVVASGRVWIEYATNRSIYLVDINGDKAPNRFGKDRFHFTFKNYNSASDCTIDPSQPIKIEPYTLTDYISQNNDWCKKPPCYYKKWLIE